ncbi:TetR family transcriptional regulator [Actinomycetospora succinea]|uniref:TetR family transcriptional regulator n=1 Tax=Actinomycetospora succinea TaxID=663603 RepID=A0A4R6UJ97_9PSEU|nr:TetR/AcrR family transcriptional regulator [Actinomycetospora succinea]TDQ47010.1 TetR family transcriptional regulator [Actinomycetospora succinea]
MTSLVLPSEPQGPRDRRVQELLYDIKDAALDQLSDGGAGGISYRMLATRIGISRSTLRYHFPTKNALIDALVADGFTALERSLRSALARTDGAPPRERWSALAHDYRRWALRHPRHYLLIHTGPALQVALHGEGPAGMERVVGVFTGFLGDDPAGLAAHARLHGAVSQELNARAAPQGLDHEALFDAQVEDLARVLDD